MLQLPLALALTLSPAPAPAPALQAGTSALPDAASTWTQWRGPARDGLVAGTPWPDALSPERLTRAWEVKGLGESYATPVVTADLVYTVATVDAKDEVVTAYDRRTGERRWETRWQGSMKVPFFAAKNGSWVRSSPAFDGEHLYVGGMRDVLVCLDGKSGAVRWRVDFSERHESPLPAFGLVCSPLVVGDHLYIQAGAALTKLDKRTGETLWRALDGQGGGMDSAFSSPMLATLAGREQVVVQSRTHLSGLDPETGKTYWTQEVPAFRGMNILTPLVHGDAVFTTAYGGRAHLYRIADSADAAAEAPRTRQSATEAWTARAQGYMTSPVSIGGHAYLFLRSNRFTCVNLESGNDTYISPPTGDEYWSLVGQGERILALADTGRLRLIAATPATYGELAVLDLVEGPSWAHLAVTSPLDPAVERGADLFVRSQTGLHAFLWR